jgi:hypothetical protein
MTVTPWQFLSITEGLLIKQIRHLLATFINLGLKSWFIFSILRPFKYIVDTILLNKCGLGARVITRHIFIDIWRRLICEREASSLWYKNVYLGFFDKGLGPMGLPNYHI